MRPAFLAPLVAVALAACQGSEPERREQEMPAPAVASDPAPATAASTAPSPPAPAVPITAVDELIGEYRVAGVDGRDINLPYGITARIDDNGIIVEADCVKLSWVWFFEDGRLVTEQLFPRDSCGRALLPEEEALVAALNGATSVGRTAANGIEIGSENGSVLLFSQ